MKYFETLYESRRKFIIVLALWMIYFLDSGIAKAYYGVILQDLIEQFEADTGTMGAILSLTQFFGFILGFVCVGDTIAMGLISSYFIEYHAATSVITTGLPLAIMSFAPMTQIFIDTYGWRGAMLLLGGLNIHFVAAAALLKPTEHIQTYSNDATYESLEKSNKAGEDNTNRFTACFKDIINISLLKNSSFIIVLFVAGIASYSFNGWVVYLISFARSKGLSPADAAIVATTSGVGSFVIRPLMALLQGQISPRQLLYVGSALVALSYAGFYFATTFLTVCSVSFVLGAGLSIVGTEVYVAAYDIIREDDAVSAVAWIHLFFGIGYIISGYVTGWLYDQSKNFDLSWIELSAVSSLPIVALGAEDLWNLSRR
ncbi:monocarboxylate transporter 2-like [Amphiura filiformis]|uniref:monocarboxylate transporter 2-like n=1 Tax=Amphiura filiformis TaxID=82378 RepID=UPI003B2273E8